MKSSLKSIVGTILVYFLPGMFFFYGLYAVLWRQILFPNTLGFFPIFGHSAMFCGASLMLVGVYFHIHAREVFFNTGQYLRDTAYLLWIAALLLIVGLLNLY